MPFKSEAQRRLFHVLEQQGKISPTKVREWEHATKNKKKLPLYVKKACAVNMPTKYADHADDRLKERIKLDLPSDTLDKLRAQAKQLKPEPGRYHLPLKNKAGDTIAIAAFKTVKPKNELILATILKPKNKPPKTPSLSHLLKQPISNRETSNYENLINKIEKTANIRKQ